MTPFGGLDLLSSSVVLVDEALVVRYLNSAAENLFAVSARSSTGRRLENVIDCPGALHEALDKALRHGWSYTGQGIELKRGDGALLHLNCTVNPVDAPEARLLIEFWPIDQQLKAAREERLLAEQLSSRELIRNLAHEIKNPLGGIRGAAQLLEREWPQPGLGEYTQVIIKEADRLQELMRRLLSPHRPMQPAPVNIHEILERVRSLIAAEFPKLGIRRDYDASLPELIGDREQLIQAVLNVARNAAQAIEGGETGRGEITLRTRAARQVTLAKRRHRLAVELQVIDDGPGVPEELRERLFYPLVSGRPGGSGLGLSLAQSFIQQHQGVIECESRPGHTAFTLRLPLISGHGDLR